ncbi:sulfite exporter TauE/SafE family protein [Zavarzinia sp. CC-PAN008]|uniref:sulfite exporter TauE/SafE family protein n=1 Tax=Zavarzinia sp. CC-PAN008 TaxID=3243332 RepID=UPI003F744F27
MTMVLLALAALAAGLARGFSGFGAALVFMPLGSALIGPAMAAPLLLVIDALTTMPLIPNAWRLGDRRAAALMTLGALVGVPAGTWLLAHGDPLALRWFVVALVLAMLALLVSGWRYRGQPRAAATVGVGVLAGFGSGAAQTGGPPVVAYWLGGALPVREARASIVLYFAVATVLTGISYGAGGLVTADLLAPGLITAPAFGLGVLLGARAVPGASEVAFRRICYAMIATSALVSLPVLDGVLR